MEYGPGISQNAPLIGGDSNCYLYYFNSCSPLPLAARGVSRNPRNPILGFCRLPAPPLSQGVLCLAFLSQGLRKAPGQLECQGGQEPPHRPGGRMRVGGD